MVRPTQRHDAPLLPAVERSAGQTFRSIPDLAWIADDDVMSVADHEDFIAKGGSWVATAQEVIVGFLCAEHLADELHIWELAVASGNQGKGIGRGLLEHALAHAKDKGLRAVTLTTFRDVPWNAPFYARCGFEILDLPALGARLEAILAHEVGLGLPASRRCAMRVALPTS